MKYLNTANFFFIRDIDFGREIEHEKELFLIKCVLNQCLHNQITQQ